MKSKKTEIAKKIHEIHSVSDSISEKNSTMYVKMIHYGVRFNPSILLNVQLELALKLI
jgi:hypothetical protein